MLIKSWNRVCLRFGGWGCRLTLSLVVPLLYKRVTPVPRSGPTTPLLAKGILPPPFLNLGHLSTSCQKFLVQVNKKWLTSVRNNCESISFGKMKELPGGAIRSMKHGSLWGAGLKGDDQGQGCPQDWQSVLTCLTSTKMKTKKFFSIPSCLT